MDIRSICLEQTAPTERARVFFERIRDPYLFRVADVTVRVEFGEDGAESLCGCIQNLLTAMER